MRTVVQGHASRSRRTLTYTALVVVALALVGCGSSSHSASTTATRAVTAHKAPAVCLPAGQTVVAQAVHAAPGAVSEKKTTGNNASPECHFAGRDGARRVLVVVNLDSSPQPYQRLERAIVEDGQQFGTERNFTPPVSVPKLGLDAAWLPDQSKLMTTDGRSLITVTVAWRGEKRARQLALAELMARRYLGKPIPNGAVPTGEA